MPHLETLSWDCSAIDDIEAWIPSDPEDVDFWMNFRIGADGTGDNYQAHVISPKNIGVRARKAGGLIVVKNYSWEAVLSHVQDILESAPATSPEDAEYVAKHLCWEYEGYKG